MTTIIAIVLVGLLLASFAAFVGAAIKQRANYGWLLPTGLACWAFLALFSRLLPN